MSKEETDKQTIEHGFSFMKAGWKCIFVEGDPHERGYAYGYLCAKEFKECQRILNFIVMESFGYSWKNMIQMVNEDIGDIAKENFKEIQEEMQGICDGINANKEVGTTTTLEEIIAWNFYYSLSYWWAHKSGGQGAKEGGAIAGGAYAGGAQDRCSAFIAVGDYTKDGKIVVAHNSFTEFIDGQLLNMVVSIQPKEGTNMIMQCAPAWIWSGSDFFVTGEGIIGTETTIAGFLPYVQKYPIGYRIRKAMQYGKTLDDYEKILLDGNSGDYANSWYFGDVNNNEIMRIELGLKYHNTERTKNGFFIGFNGPYDPEIRNLECANTGFYDIRRHQGARKVRLGDLMEQYKGKIDLELARKIIADHYDVYLKKENPCSRTVCSHYDLDAREYMSDPSRPKPYQPHGAIDGIVTDSELAKRMGFMGRYGNSCGIEFNADEYFKKNKQYANFQPYIWTRPSQPWVEFVEMKVSGSGSESKSQSKAITTTKTKGGRKKHGKKRTLKRKIILH